MSEEQVTYDASTVSTATIGSFRIVRNAQVERLKVGRPRRKEYDELAQALVAWFGEGSGSGNLSVGPFHSVKERVRLRMGFPRSLAYTELPEALRKNLRTRLSADRKTIFYYVDDKASTNNKKEA